MKLFTCIVFLAFVYMLWVHSLYYWVVLPSQRPLWYHGRNTRLLTYAMYLMLILSSLLLFYSFGPWIMFAAILPPVMAAFAVSRVVYRKQLHILHAREIKRIQQEVQEVLAGRKVNPFAFSDEFERSLTDAVRDKSGPTDGDIDREADRAARIILREGVRGRYSG